MSLKCHVGGKTLIKICLSFRGWGCVTCGKLLDEGSVGNRGSLRDSFKANGAASPNAVVSWRGLELRDSAQMR